MRLFLKAFPARSLFFFSHQAQVDIVSVALVGTYELLPMDTYHIKCPSAGDALGEPIPTTRLTNAGLGSGCRLKV